MTTDISFESLDYLQSSQEQGISVGIPDPENPNKFLFSITVHGPDSKQQRRAIERRDEEYEARGANTPLTPEEQKRVNIMYLARCCSAWDLKRPGQDAVVSFNEDVLYALMDKYPYVRVIVDGAAANRLRFTKRSQTA